MLKGGVTLRAELFITCFNDTLFPDTGRAVVAILERQGISVGFPFEQTCCGQMHYNTGYQSEALSLIRRFVEVFSEAEAVVSPSASCVAMVHDMYPMAAERSGDEELSRAVAALAPRVYEFSQFLIDVLGIDDVGAYFPHRVTYHPTCHSLRALHVGDAPIRLLRKVAGIDLVELERADECCGFGGTFAIKNADTSAAILSDKTRNVLNTHSEVCTALDNSCLMHIGGALRRGRTGIGTMHLAEILAHTRDGV